MRCPHCHFLLTDSNKANPAQFILCNRCGRIWIDTGAQRPQGVLEAPLARPEQPYQSYQPDFGSPRPHAVLKAV